MIDCKNCEVKIDGSTDDNYNSDHTAIKCPECERWQPIEAESPDEIKARHSEVRCLFASGGREISFKAENFNDARYITYCLNQQAKRDRG